MYHKISAIETLESRTLMSTVVQSSDNTITDLGSSFGYTAVIRWGDNGEGAFDSALMESYGGIDNSAPIQWVSNPTVAFDTGWLYFKYTLNLSSPDAQSNLEIDGTNVPVDEGTTGTIHGVAIRAAVGSGGYATSLQNVQTTFFSNGNEVDSGPTFNESADLLNSTTSDESETVTQINTTASNVNEVVVSGYIRMQGVANQSPTPFDLFSDITVS